MYLMFCTFAKRPYIPSEVMHKTVCLKYISYQFLKKHRVITFDDASIRYLLLVAGGIGVGLPLLICFQVHILTSLVKNIWQWYHFVA
jgi:hypothetical protein